MKNLFVPCLILALFFAGCKKESVSKNSAFELKLVTDDLPSFIKKTPYLGNVSGSTAPVTYQANDTLFLCFHVFLQAHWIRFASTSLADASTGKEVYGRVFSIYEQNAPVSYHYGILSDFIERDKINLYVLDGAAGPYTEFSNTFFVFPIPLNGTDLKGKTLDVNMSATNSLHEVKTISVKSSIIVN